MFINSGLLKQERRLWCTFCLFVWLAVLLEFSLAGRDGVSDGGIGTAAVAQEGREICDFDELVRRCGGIAEVAERVLKKFLDKSGRYLQDIENAVSKANAEELTAQSHKLKGVAANLAAHTVRDTAEELERLGRAGGLSDAPKLLEKLHADLKAFENAVSAKLNRTSVNPSE